MATRHHARMAVVSLLYAYDLGNQSIAEFSDEILEEKISKKKKSSIFEFKGKRYTLNLDKIYKLKNNIEKGYKINFEDNEIEISKRPDHFSFINLIIFLKLNY